MKLDARGPRDDDPRVANVEEVLLDAHWSPTVQQPLETQQAAYVVGAERRLEARHDPSVLNHQTI
jgi:hypothetical protein